MKFWLHTSKSALFWTSSILLTAQATELQPQNRLPTDTIKSPLKKILLTFFLLPVLPHKNLFGCTNIDNNAATTSSGPSSHDEQSYSGLLTMLYFFMLFFFFIFSSVKLPRDLQ